MGALLVLGPASPVHAGDSVTITVEKVIVGEAPPGAEFVVGFDCGQAGVDEFTFSADALTPQSTFALLGDCTLAETADGGADAVSYDCVASGPGVGPCVTSSTGVEIEFLASNGGGDAFIMVTNTFEAEPTTTAGPETTTTAAAAAAQAVTRQPAFTG
jgi:hypothetical protein